MTSIIYYYLNKNIQKLVKINDKKKSNLMPYCREKSPQYSALDIKILIKFIFP